VSTSATGAAETRADQARQAEQRKRLASLPDVEFVEPEQFIALSVSTRCLVRADVPAAGLRGLRDARDGNRFFIEEEKLRELRPQR